MNARKMAETSLDAFLEKKEDGSLSEDQEKVLNHVANFGPITLNETAELMDRYPNQISGRFTELKDEGLIKVTGREDGKRLYEAVEK